MPKLAVVFHRYLRNECARDNFHHNLYQLLFSVSKMQDDIIDFEVLCCEGGDHTVQTYS